MFHEVIFSGRAATLKISLQKVRRLSLCHDPMMTLNSKSKGIAVVSGRVAGEIIKRADIVRSHLLSVSLGRACLEANMPACAAFISGFAFEMFVLRVALLPRSCRSAQLLVLLRCCSLLLLYLYQPLAPRCLAPRSVS